MALTLTSASPRLISAAAYRRVCVVGGGSRSHSVLTPAAAQRLMYSLPHATCPWHGAGCSGLHSSGAAPTSFEYAFELSSSSVRFGSGVTREVGMDVAASGAKRVLVYCDPTVAALPGGGPLKRVLDSLSAAGLTDVHVTTDVAVEPTDASLARAIAEARRIAPHAFVAVGGGSVMDTAKAANLYYSHPSATLLDFVNAPIGRGLPVPGPVKPLFAIPTTAGTGSETTGVAIFDYEPLHAKTGIASRVIKPTLGLVDPDNTATMPREVAVASGFDVLCHALESYTALPYTARSPRPARPAERPAYQGANPFSDQWSLYALRLCAKYFLRAGLDRSDAEANMGMTLAATAASYGFGNSGVHLAHGCSYGISGLNPGYSHPGYVSPKPLVPHGISVVLPAPAIFRATAPACPERHAIAAAILAGEEATETVAMYSSSGPRPPPAPRGSRAADAADAAGARLAEQLVRYMEALHVPNGLSALGFTSAHVPALVKATVPQRRVLALAPAPDNATEDALSAIFEGSMRVW